MSRLGLPLSSLPLLCRLLRHPVVTRYSMVDVGDVFVSSIVQPIIL